MISSPPKNFIHDVTDAMNESFMKKQWLEIWKGATRKRKSF